MNKAWTTTIVCLHFLFLQFSNAQCPTGDVHLHSQAEVDFFTTNFPNCADIKARLIIGHTATMVGSDINDLSGLTSIMQTKGLIIQNNPLLDDLNGLGNLKKVNGDMVIHNNLDLDELADLTSLYGNLKSLTISGNGEISDLYGLENTNISGGNLSIENNAMLETLEGIGQVTSVYNLRIGNNPWLSDISDLNLLTTTKQVKIHNLPILTNLDGLDALDNVNGSIEIVDLPLLSDIQGLGNLQTVGGTFTLAMLPSLPVLDGLENLSNVYTLVLMNNPGLKNVNALSALSNIQNLQIASCSNLESLEGLEGVVEIDNLLLLDNPGLLSLFGLQNLNEIKMHVQISLNSALQNLDDLSSLSAIRGALAIVDNDELISISGIETAILDGFQLIVIDNAKLSHCHVKNVCAYVGLTAVQATISNNDIGCKSVPEVHNACKALALPVELLSFDVVKIGEQANLNWETASEFNNAGFEVQRSSDGQNWNTIGFVESKEIQQARNIYQYRDTPELKGNVYYRLLQVDNDGLTKTGEVKSLNFGYVDSNLSVFPNPAQDRVTIEYQVASELAKEVDVRLYDLTGQLRKTGRSDRNGFVNLGLQGLPVGYYTLVVDGFSTKLIIGK